MKRILSLILALIFCLSFIVSCEKEEISSSSEQTDENKGLVMTESRVRYYYHSPLYETDNTEQEVQMAENLKDLTERVLALNPNAIVPGVVRLERRLERFYVFILVNVDNTDLMGYRNVSKTNDGYAIIKDVRHYCDSFAIGEGGLAGYEYLNNEKTEYVKTAAGYRILLIPKSEFDIPPTAENIQFHEVTYTFVKQFD